jgi:hypothetical protein
MRKINCRNIQREIEEAGPGDVLSSEVDQHLANCTACGTLARQQANLQKIVSSLGTVEAPGDFDFRLRARLAADKRRPQPFALAGVSFGLRSAAMAMMLILAGAAILFIALRTRSDNSTPETVAATAPNRDVPKPVDPTVGATINPAAGTVEPASTVATTVATSGSEIDKSSEPAPVKRRGTGQTTFASYRPSRQQTRDLSSTGALVLKDDQFAGAYPSAAFPIDASNQSLKVSIDDGRGSSRTISLPTVSFGSQRPLSQGASPLMASARGDW